MQLGWMGDDLTRSPMREIGIALPIDAVAVQEDAGPGAQQEFIDLTAGIAQVNVRRHRIAHVGRGFAAQIHMDVVTMEIAVPDRPGPVHAQPVDCHYEWPFKEHDVRGEQEFAVVPLAKIVEYVPAMPIPG